ncbi:hypothetical protein HZS38_01945 [Xenorhabdus nematophila]|uniref:Uncharacterized protein n=1 Tax=Xenorhabdus nematophila (strain ATCC 19061 / DSM 3370 / CCUG 14189 / LMG 1036 / NCIMB 9965 / AN6) TaxID=406817 RepID=D3VLK6_XENNA|nr:hypothetical protein [Xenorhabdus nematophila]CEE91146.1 hypothetical protein XNA1_1980006 [Xenorhabdus nematophila str. Anatoliense]CEF32817.1 hypothetical protein XNW1_4530029 [Xenorhabdus nematophila str. Websteri]AYA39446.1 hypothetical protein D3790_02270 [Xenorhabdus nematophila]KHD28431.1 hypothetical protein LH67_10520 [Xenorhabdus nematophila]MBA0018012.1 hypothetical protein [Xenorhabdus nematophila]
MTTEYDNLQGTIQSLSGAWDVGSTIYVPADLRGQVINIIRGPGLEAAEQAIAVPLINGTSEQRLTRDGWMWLQYSFSEGSTTIKVVWGNRANFTQIFYRV